eukprot:5272659-Prymnesium_polylepis.3
MEEAAKAVAGWAVEGRAEDEKAETREPVMRVVAKAETRERAMLAVGKGVAATVGRTAAMEMQEVGSVAATMDKGVSRLT